MVKPLPDAEQTTRSHDDTSRGAITQGGRRKRTTIGWWMLAAILLAGAAGAGFYLIPARQQQGVAVSSPGDGPAAVPAAPAHH